MTSKEILSAFINFYTEKGHKLVPNVSLIPEGDSTLLFVNSGMFPLVPYLLGQTHPLGKRLVNFQRALRLEDIDAVGDYSHTTAFHMIGNWSLGDYFKNEQLPWAFEFLIEELKLDPNRLYSTVFAGDESAPKDNEAIEILKKIYSKYGIDAKENERIFAYGKKSNWWQRGDAVGEPGGPDSEIYYYMGDGNPPKGQWPEDDESNFFEIANSVFMQYIKTENSWKPLEQANVDFGGGLERIAVVVQQKKDIYETDNFWPIIQKICELTKKDYYESAEIKKNMRVIADHMRACTFLAMDGVVPSNKDQGYILRRLLRRMVRAARTLGVEKDLSVNLVKTVSDTIEWLYPNLPSMQKSIEKTFAAEETKFFATLKRGAVLVDKALTDKNLSEQQLAQKAFELYQSLGYPSEIFLEDAKDRGFKVSEKEFNRVFQEIFNKHQQTSRAGMEKKFKGGLADTGQITVAYHTTTHLLQRALKNVLGEHVRQLGSNINAERLRFDFPHPQKLTSAEILETQKIINQTISAKMPVNFVIMPREESMQSGALYLTGESYPEEVKVYFIGESYDKAFSKELCGGPHVTNTEEIGEIEIYKQETIGEGKQRIYARFKH